MIVKGHTEQSTFYPTDSPSGLFLRRCFSAGPGSFPSPGEKAALTELAEEQHLYLVSETQPCREAALSWYQEHQDGEQT